MKSRYLLLIVLSNLGTSAFANGDNSVSATKDYKSKLKAFQRLQVSLADEATGRPLRSRQRLELLTSLEEDVYEPPQDNLKALWGQTILCINAYEAVKNGTSTSIPNLRKLFRKKFSAQVKAFKNVKASSGLFRSSFTRSRGVKVNNIVPED